MGGEKGRGGRGTGLKILVAGLWEKSVKLFRLGNLLDVETAGSYDLGDVDTREGHFLALVADSDGVSDFDSFCYCKCALPPLFGEGFYFRSQVPRVGAENTLEIVSDEVWDNLEDTISHFCVKHLSWLTKAGRITVGCVCHDAFAEHAASNDGDLMIFDFDGGNFF